MYNYNAKVISITDADTLVLLIDFGMCISQTVTVRLNRINAPEIHGVLKNSTEYASGMASKRFVEDFIKGTNNNVNVTTIKDKKEKYGRYLAEIVALEGPFIGKNLSDELLTHGFAKTYGD